MEAPAPDPSAAPPSHRPSLLQLWLRNRRERFRQFHLGGLGLEVVAIFLGITISFLFDEWREDRQERARERILLEKLDQELTAKLAELRSDHRQFIQHSDRLRDLIGYTRDLPLPDSMRKGLGRVVGFTTATSYFQPYTPTYVALNNTEGHRLIQDTAVTRLLYDTYETRFVGLSLAYTELERVKHQLVADHFRRVGLFRLIYDNSDLSPRELDNPETKSQLLVLLMQLEGLTGQNDDATIACEVLQQRIKDRIKKL